MSAFTVSAAHIDVLVTALRQARLIGAGTERVTGQLLLDANVRSVRHLDGTAEEPSPVYVPHTTRAHLHPLAVLKACQCYEYQAGDHPSWHGSHAAWLINSLRTPLAARVGPFYRSTPAYAALPWHFTHVSQALACHQKGH